jgi:hypothetical protein
MPLLMVVDGLSEFPASFLHCRFQDSQANGRKHIDQFANQQLPVSLFLLVL